MKRTTKRWMRLATNLAVIGVIVLVIAMAANGWELSALGSGEYDTTEYEIHEEFQSVSIQSDTEDIAFVPSEDGKCRVVFYEQEKVQHTAAVQDGTLAIGRDDSRKWYETISLFSFDSPKMTIYLPEGEYAALSIDENTGDIEIPADFSFESVDISVSTGDVDCRASATGQMKIGTSTGDIRVEGASVGALSLSVSTGRVEVSSVACEGDAAVSVSTGKAKLTDVSCGSLASAGSTGDITLKNVIAEGLISIKRSTGDVKLEQCDAGELLIDTSTGDVNGSLLTEKVFIAQSDTGRVQVPETINGGKCKITTDTGSIRMSVQAAE